MSTKLAAYLRARRSAASCVSSRNSLWDRVDMSRCWRWLFDPRRLAKRCSMARKEGPPDRKTKGTRHCCVSAVRPARLAGHTTCHANAGYAGVISPSAHAGHITSSSVGISGCMRCRPRWTVDEASV